MTNKEYPDENWENDYSRRSQKWIHNKFVGQGGLEGFFPESVPSWLEYGYKLSDLQRAFDDATNAQMGIDQLVQVADHLSSEARRAEERGLEQTALEYYHRAALGYFRAQWSRLSVEGDKRNWHQKGEENYRKVIEYADADVELVDIELPNHEASMAAVFHACGEENAPTVLGVPGMDQVKEEYVSPFNNRFAKRGMNVLVIDGPGQGKTRIRGVCDDDYDTYQKAGRAAVDWLVKRPEVDADKIGVAGNSMGTYWAPRIAYEDDRISALAISKGCFYSKDQLFNQAQPFFKKRFMFMSGIYDEAEFDKYSADMTLYGIDEEITIPTFIAHGEYDELQTRQQAKLLFDRLAGPKQLNLYENEFHPIGGVPADMWCDLTDWFVRVWRGDIGEDYDKLNYVADYPSESYIPTTEFE